MRRNTAKQSATISATSWQRKERKWGKRMSICDNCMASKNIKSTWGCSCDGLHNAWEDFKYELFKGCRPEYVPKYQCRFADLVEMEMGEREK